MTLPIAPPNDGIKVALANDPANWAPYNGGSPGGEQQWAVWDSSTWTVDGDGVGTMHVTIGADGRYHVTGIVFAGLKMTHGRLRACVRKADDHGGNTATFHDLIMLWDESRTWPAGGELDLDEGEAANYHWPSSYNPNSWGFGHAYTPRPDMTQWGVWEAVWTPTAIDVYWTPVDGLPVQIDHLDIPPGADCPGPMTPIFQAGSPGNKNSPVGGVWQVAWMASDSTTNPPSGGGTSMPAGAPVNTTPPAIGNMSPQVGQDLQVTPGTWTGSPSLSYHLFHEQADEGVLVGLPYTVAAGDVGHRLSILEIATGAGGMQASKFNGPWTAAVTPAPPPPPAAAGTTEVDSARLAQLNTDITAEQTARAAEDAAAAKVETDEQGLQGGNG